MYQVLAKKESTFKSLKSVEYSTLFYIYVIMLHNSYVQIFIQKKLDDFLSIQGDLYPKSIHMALDFTSACDIHLTRSYFDAKILDILSNNSHNCQVLVKIMMENGLTETSEEMNCSSNECEFKQSVNNNIEADYEPLFDVEEDEDCGRYLVASQNIEQGQVILFEKPTGRF